LQVKEIQSREGVKHFKVKGKGDKIRYVPLHPLAQRLSEQYLVLAAHADADGALFQPVRNNRTGGLERPLNANPIYRNVVRKYGQATGLNIEVNGLYVDSMRTTAATNALSHEADIAKV
jgi:integrase/recombinase XerD